MKTLTISAAVAASFAGLGTSVYAQGEAAYSAGQVVEVKSYFFIPPWHKAKILNVGTQCPYPETPYRVHFIGDDAGDHGDPCVGANEIRPLPEGQQGAAAPANGAAAPQGKNDTPADAPPQR